MKSIRRGFTLLEIVIAAIITIILVGLTLGTIFTMARPMTDTTVRADLTAKGNATVDILVEELEGGAFISPANAVGTYSAGPPVTAGSPFDFGSGTPTISTGNAVQFQTITGFTPPGTLLLDPDQVVYAFVADDVGDSDRDGLINELRLIRHKANEAPVTIQKDIVSSTQPPNPSGIITFTDPTFTLEHPANLRVRFIVMKPVGYNTDKNLREFAFLEFDRTINLRNLNQ